MTTVEGILNFDPTQEEDLYGILGVDQSSTVEQITAEYKVKALQFHPDKNEGDKEAEEKFQKLKEAKEILCDPERRKNYDKWRNSGISMSYKQWLGMKEHVHQALVRHLSEYDSVRAVTLLEEGYSQRGVARRLGVHHSTIGRALKSMHWTTLKTKDRMLDVGEGSGKAPPANRRASEGGANIHWGARSNVQWDNQPPSDVVNKFRNYEI